MSPMNDQDAYQLRNLLGVAKDSDIPDAVLEWYEYIRRLKHRVQAGPLCLSETVMIVALSEIGVCRPQRGASEAQSAAEEESHKPKAKLPGVSLPVAGLLFVEGHEYFIERNGEWLKGIYKKPGKDGKLRFVSAVDPSVFYEVETSQVRLAG